MENITFIQGIIILISVFVFTKITTRGYEFILPIVFVFIALILPTFGDFSFVLKEKREIDEDVYFFYFLFTAAIVFIVGLYTKYVGQFTSNMIALFFLFESINYVIFSAIIPSWIFIIVYPFINFYLNMYIAAGKMARY